MFASSRRHFLQTVVAVAGSATLEKSGVQSPAALAYSVGKWSGPLSAFMLTDLDGETWQPADLTGRAVLLNFWATWCEPCRAEMPALQQLAERHGWQAAGAGDQLQGQAGACAPVREKRRLHAARAARH